MVTLSFSLYLPAKQSPLPYMCIGYVGAAKNNYSFKRRLQFKPKHSQAGQGAPKQGLCLRTTNRKVIEVLPEQTLNHQLVLFVGSD